MIFISQLESTVSFDFFSYTLKITLLQIIKMKLTEATTCKLNKARPQKETLRKKFFVFESKCDLVSDVNSPTTDLVTSQEDQRTDPQNVELEDAVETLRIYEHRILIIQFRRGVWGDWNAELVVVTDVGEAEIKIITPGLTMVVRCIIRNGGPSMGLSYVGFYLPNSTVARHQWSGICFWYNPMGINVSVSTKPATKTLHWPVYYSDPQEVAAYDVPSESLPIRLIDIQGTVSSNGGIYFIKPTSWSFHTISHTWSKGVRDFSAAVGRKVSSAESYNRAFEDANFLDDPSKEARDCYSHLMDFLRLLHEEGVNAVWFDALCINQENNDEKEREIAGMGEYYWNSLGCYVLSHGIGMGFALWAPSDDKVKLRGPGKCAFDDDKFQEKPALPRWFHRVWTLQEFVLPQKLTFIVAGLAKATIGRVNKFIRRGKGPGLCMCALPARLLHFRYWDNNLHIADEEEDIISPEQGCKDACNSCGHIPFIRKLVNQNKGTYLVDREAYCFLCQLDLGPSEQHNSDLSLTYSDPEYVLWSLNAVAFARHGLRRRMTSAALSLLRVRDCTNEEDRVLGVLGLLLDGNAGRFQVRTGTSLHQQIWRLHETVGHPVFLKLCMMNVEGYSAVGMSWAPRLDRLSLSEASLTVLKGDLNMPLLDRSFLVGVFDEGPRQGIFVVASIISAQLVPEDQMMPCNRFDRHSDPERKRISRVFDGDMYQVEVVIVEVDGIGATTGGNLGSFCGECINHSPACKHLIRPCKLIVESEKCGHLELPFEAHEGGCSKRSVVRIASSAKGGIPDADFRMVLTGVVSVSALKPFPVQLVRLVVTSENVFGLICITRRDDNNMEVLHKIGTFSCPLLDTWSFDPSIPVLQDPDFPYERKVLMARDPLFPISNRSCLIGGFGNDISQYVCS